MKSKTYLNQHLNQTEYSNANTPASKADACASCDLPFDESDIAPALRKENFSVDTLDSHREKKRLREFSIELYRFRNS